MGEWMVYFDPKWYHGCDEFDSEEKAREKYEELKKKWGEEGDHVYLLKVVEKFKLQEFNKEVERRRNVNA